MEIIGFIALLALGVYLVISSYAIQRLSLGFGGKLHWGGFVILIIGMGLLYLSWRYAPFTITLNTK